MEDIQQKQTHTIDATGKRLGRVATEAAQVLMGKTTTNFNRHEAGTISVHIINAGELFIDEKKRTQKTYVRYTGYPSGKREETMEKLIARHGIEEVIRKAVYGMLPGNKLRSVRMKRLSITV
jgi:large subunit ribosomal protein L13